MNDGTVEFFHCLDSSDPTSHLESLIVYVIANINTFSIEHAFLGYIYDGEYFGDYELDLAAIPNLLTSGDFTKVVK